MKKLEKVLGVIFGAALFIYISIAAPALFIGLCLLVVAAAKGGN